MSAKEIKDTFAKARMRLDGVSSHCPFWVHTSAWSGTPGIRPFTPADVAKKSVDDIEKWAEDYLLRLLDLCAELGIKIVPMFWGVAFRWGQMPDRECRSFSLLGRRKLGDALSESSTAGVCVPCEELRHSPERAAA